MFAFDNLCGDLYPVQRIKHKRNGNSAKLQSVIVYSVAVGNSLRNRLLKKKL